MNSASAAGLVSFVLAQAITRSSAVQTIPPHIVRRPNLRRQKISSYFRAIAVVDHRSKIYCSKNFFRLESIILQFFSE